jgi:hypothetical protein
MKRIDVRSELDTGPHEVGCEVCCDGWGWITRRWFGGRAFSPCVVRGARPRALPWAAMGRAVGRWSGLESAVVENHWKRSASGGMAGPSATLRFAQDDRLLLVSGLAGLCFAQDGRLLLVSGLAGLCFAQDDRLLLVSGLAGCASLRMTDCCWCLVLLGCASLRMTDLSLVMRSIALDSEGF